MLDAYSATMVAFMTDGGVIHYDHLPEDIHVAVEQRLEDEGLSDRYFYSILEEEYGYTGLIRYSIHEWESANWDDLEYQVDFELSDEEPDWVDETVIDANGDTRDVSAYIAVMCDQCGERIE